MMSTETAAAVTALAAQTAAAVCALTASGDKAGARALLAMYEAQTVPVVGRYASLRVLLSSLIGVSVMANPDAEEWSRMATALELKPVA